MLSKLILCLTAKYALMGYWRFGKFISCTRFANNEVGQLEFSRYLQAHPGIPITLMTDVVEEDFRQETLPHTTGSDRQELLQRKLNQIYRNTSYRTAQYAGREDGKRHDDHFVFMALTNQEFLTPWVAILKALQVPISGVYLLPSVSRLLLGVLGLKPSNRLLMTRQSAGIRHTYFTGHYPRISRLTPIHDLDDLDIKQLYQSEILKTRLYLVSQRLVTREQVMDVLFLSLDDKDPALPSELGEQGGITCRVIVLGELSKRTGINAEQLKTTPELLHMHALARYGMPDGNLIPKVLTQEYTLYRAKWALNLTSSTLLFGASLYAAYNYLVEHQLRDELAQVTQQTQWQTQQYETAALNFPKTPLPGDDLKTAVTLAKTLDGLKATPERLMKSISPVLEIMPRIQLNRLHWVLTGNENLQDNDKKSTPKVDANSAISKSSPGLKEVGFLDGEISGFDGNYRAALDQVNAMAAALKNQPSIDKVDIVQQPINTSSQVSLEGNTLDTHNQQRSTAQFKIKVVLKVRADK